jgi:hypothetical protein
MCVGASSLLGAHLGALCSEDGVHGGDVLHRVVSGSGQAQHTRTAAAQPLPPFQIAHRHGQSTRQRRRCQCVGLRRLGVQLSQRFEHLRTYSSERESRESHESGFGWEMSSRGRFATLRRCPSPRLEPVPRAIRTPRKFGRCPSFKGRFLWFCANPSRFATSTVEQGSEDTPACPLRLRQVPPLCPLRRCLRPPCPACGTGSGSSRRAPPAAPRGCAGPAAATPVQPSAYQQTGGMPSVDMGMHSCSTTTWGGTAESVVYRWLHHKEQQLIYQAHVAWYRSDSPPCCNHLWAHVHSPLTQPTESGH